MLKETNYSPISLKNKKSPTDDEDFLVAIP
jgi:hypothetical protein